MASGKLCQECRQRPAAFHLTQVTNNNTTQLSLCEQCARERGELEFFMEPKFGIHGLLTGLLQQGLGRRTARGPGSLTCPGCGLTYQQFAETGLLGCRQCYETFADVIDPIVGRIHGSSHHVGKVPVAGRKQQRGTGTTTTATQTAKGDDADDAERLQRLKTQLEQAVAEERFEDAAVLRDQIRELQRRVR